VRPIDIQEDEEDPDIDDLCIMFKALCGLEALFSYRGKANYPCSIVYRLTAKQLPLWNTLEILRFDQTNEWGEEHIVQLHLVRENGKVKEAERTTQWERYEPGLSTGPSKRLLTGELQDLRIDSLLAFPGVSFVDVTSLNPSNEGDDEEDGDWVDDEESDGWSERDYEDDSDESDWDSEDDSDYEDDWEAEYGFTPSPKVEPVKDVSIPPTGAIGRGPSLLDF
jgi:hypothetical protein